MSDLEITEKTPENSEKNVTPKSSSDVPEFTPIQGFFGIDNPTGEQSTQLQAIFEYFSKDDNEGSTLMGIRSTENRLGAPKLGETRTGKLYEYVRLQNQIKGLESERDSLVQ